MAHGAFRIQKTPMTVANHSTLNVVAKTNSNSTSTRLGDNKHRITI